MGNSDYVKKLQEAAKKRARIVQMRLSGKTITAIGEKLGMSHQRVSQVIREERAKGNIE